MAQVVDDFLGGQASHEVLPGGEVDEQRRQRRDNRRAMSTLHSFAPVDVFTRSFSATVIGCQSYDENATPNTNLFQICVNCRIPRPDWPRSGGACCFWRESAVSTS